MGAAARKAICARKMNAKTQSAVSADEDVYVDDPGLRFLPKEGFDATSPSDSADFFCDSWVKGSLPSYGPVEAPAATDLASPRLEDVQQFYGSAFGIFLISNPRMQIPNYAIEQIRRRPGRAWEILRAVDPRSEEDSNHWLISWQAALARSSDILKGYPRGCLPVILSPRVDANDVRVFNFGGPDRCALKLDSDRITVSYTSVSNLKCLDVKARMTVITGSTWRDVDLENVVFEHCLFKNTRFEDVCMKNVKFSHVDFTDVTIRQVQITDTSILHTKVSASNFEHHCCNYSRLERCSISELHSLNGLWMRVSLKAVVIAKSRRVNDCLHDMKLHGGDACIFIGDDKPLTTEPQAAPAAILPDPATEVPRTDLSTPEPIDELSREENAESTFYDASESHGDSGDSGSVSSSDQTLVATEASSVPVSEHQVDLAVPNRDSAGPQPTGQEQLNSCELVRSPVKTLAVYNPAAPSKRTREEFDQMFLELRKKLKKKSTGPAALDTRYKYLVMRKDNAPLARSEFWTRSDDFYAYPRQLVYKYLLPQGHLTVIDHPKDSAFVEKNRKRSTFYSFKKGSSSLSSSYYVFSSEADFNLNRNCLAIAFLNDTVRKEVASLVYSQGIHFFGSPQSARAFLHDHTRYFFNLKKIDLYFRVGTENTNPNLTLPGHDKGISTSIPRTDLAEWRMLLNILVHNCPNIQVVTLHLNSLFWDTCWEGLSSIKVNYEDPLPYSKGDKSFLEHVARFHGPRVDFLLVAEEPVESSLSKACIERAVDKLKAHMIAEMQDRPLYENPCECKCLSKGQTRVSLVYAKCLHGPKP